VEQRARVAWGFARGLPLPRLESPFSVPPKNLDADIKWGYINSVKITFDKAKREQTLARRGLDFADAAEVFKELHTVLADDRFDYGERRYISAGYLRRRMVVIVWTLRGGTRHIISMRYCHAKEEARWRKHLEGLG
jgi:uncharacterized protein